MIPLWSNPEFIRNCRAQLRPRRLLLVASIIAALSLVVGYSLYQTFNARPNWAITLFSLAAYAQLLTLCLIGGYSCLRSIAQEREQNTFDYQRVTQLSSLDLTLGKLFGAPAVAYFAALCMLPAALVGAFAGGIPLSRLFGAYLILLVGSIVVQAVTLLFSMATTKTGSGVTGLSVIALIVIFLSMTGAPEPSRAMFDMGTIGPAAAVQFATSGTWQIRAGAMGSPPQVISQSPWTDVFFGMPAHHLLVLLVLYVTLTLWSLVPLVRNLKKDPGILELYSPGQSVGLLCYLNLLMVGFFMVYHTDDSVSQFGMHTYAYVFEFFLVVNLIFLYLLGLTLIRNREQTRRRLHHRASTRFKWMETAWPSAYVLVCAVTVVLLVMARFAFVRGLRQELNVPFALFQAGLLLATMLRDLCFLQWINLRRSKHPLMLGIVLLSVFYLCGGLLLSMANFSDPVRHAITAIVIPWPLASAGAAEQSAWSLNPTPWFIGLAVQVALLVLFAALHYKSTEELRPVATASPANAQAFGD